MKIDNTLKTVSKSETELRVANYIVLFGGEDLHGERFLPETKFDSSYTESGVLHVDFEHGRDPDKVGLTEHDVLGVVDWSTAKTDATGVFVERSLKRQARYMAALEHLIDNGKIGTSSEAIAGKVKRENGDILEWPLKRDTLTFTPAEPRMLADNVLHAAKCLLDEFPNSKSLEVVQSTIDLKSSIEEAKSFSEIESILRDAGFTRTAATALVSRVKSMSRSDSEAKDRSVAISEIIQRFTISSHLKSE
jgi:hypothetical protein